MHAATDQAQAYLMRIADLLSDDPLLLDVIGPTFKVIADYDRKAKRVTYSFRLPDDLAPSDQDATSV
jgi:hypothetical protein